MANETLTLESEGDAFRLRQTDKNGRSSEILLTETSLLTLAQSALRLKVSILAKQSRLGVDKVVVTPVVQIGLNTDLERSAIHLTMIEQNGAALTFGLPLEVAKPLSENLPRRVAEIETAIVNKTIQ